MAKTYYKKEPCVVLEMTREEAIFIYKLLGLTTGNGMTGVYDALGDVLDVDNEDLDWPFEDRYTG